MILINGVKFNDTEFHNGEVIFEKPEVQKIEIEDPIEETKEVKKETVTKKDIARAIVALDCKQLDELDAKIRYLSELKKNKKLILDKDIA